MRAGLLLILLLIGFGLVVAWKSDTVKELEDFFRQRKAEQELNAGTGGIGAFGLLLVLIAFLLCLYMTRNM
jgi:hypothetical protein